MKDLVLTGLCFLKTFKRYYVNKRVLHEAEVAEEGAVGLRASFKNTLLV